MPASFQGYVMTCVYSPTDVEIMRKTDLSKNKSRLQELVDFAKASGFRRLGIANCKSVQPYADKLANILRQAGFEVFTVNCKESGLKGADVCNELRGPCCDPLFQAAFLNEKKTEFNIEVGLCLGHGLLFQKYSQAAVTSFLVKDFAHMHNTAAALEDIPA